MVDLLHYLCTRLAMYFQAKEKMAEILISHRKDRKLYIACYQELAEKLPGPPTALLLGDAYMNVQEV